MNWLFRFLNSNIGLKLVMALSGLMLVGFVIAHMLGNLQVFLGPDALNEYAAGLQSKQALVWTARVGLIGAALAHIFSAVTLTMRSKKARGPDGYKKHTWLSERYAARTMRLGGIILLAFIIYHILHLTVGLKSIDQQFVHCNALSGEFRCDAYGNMVRGFMTPAVAIFYVVANIFLGLHLTHGVWSALRTLGVGSPRWDAIARNAAYAVGTIITLGNCSMPIAVMAGIVTL